MKIISNKKWEEMNQTLVDLQMELNDKKEEYAILNEQVAYLQRKLRAARDDNYKLGNLIVGNEKDIVNYKKTIKALKTLLTKNKIDYNETLERLGDINVRKTNKNRDTKRKTK